MYYVTLNTAKSWCRDKALELPFEDTGFESCHSLQIQSSRLLVTLLKPSGLKKLPQSIKFQCLTHKGKRTYERHKTSPNIHFLSRTLTVSSLLGLLSPRPLSHTDFPIKTTFLLPSLPATSLTHIIFLDLISLIRSIESQVPCTRPHSQMPSTYGLPLGRNTKPKPT
jgi:hypothetical protein